MKTQIFYLKRTKCWNKFRKRSKEIINIFRRNQIDSKKVQENNEKLLTEYHDLK